MQELLPVEQERSPTGRDLAHMKEPLVSQQSPLHNLLGKSLRAACHSLVILSLCFFDQLYLQCEPWQVLIMQHQLFPLKFRF